MTDEAKPDRETKMSTTPDTAKVLVCDKCLRACCWYGEFMCKESRGAGLKILTIADLRRLDREHADYWSDEKMIKVYGSADRQFRI